MQMNHEDFKRILKVIEPDVTLRQVMGGHKAIVEAERFTVTLGFLATWETYRSLSPVSYFESGGDSLHCTLLLFFYLRRDRLYFLRRVTENFPHLPYRILTSTRNKRSKYKQWIIALETCPQSQLNRHACVQQCWTLWPFLFTLENKKNSWIMLKMIFDGNQTSFNVIQHNATSCNMVAKRVQHAGSNNVEWCCIDMLDPFDWALNKTSNFTPSNLVVFPSPPSRVTPH